MLKKSGLLAVLLLLSVGLSVKAQSTTVGSISGTVRDEKGAGVPKAEVVIQGEGTGFSRTVNADDNGFYLASSLPVGKYTVSTAPQGFKKSVATAVDLHVSENRVVNLDVQVGQISETVTVSSDAAPVETRSGDVSSLISEKQITSQRNRSPNYRSTAATIHSWH